MSKMQDSVKSFCLQHNLQTTAVYRLLDLCSELGELAKELLKATDYGKNPQLTVNAKLIDELGDVYFSLCCLANELDIPLDEALQQALVKYQERIKSRHNPGSGR